MAQDVPARLPSHRAPPVAGERQQLFGAEQDDVLQVGVISSMAACLLCAGATGRLSCLQHWMPAGSACCNGEHFGSASYMLQKPAPLLPAQSMHGSNEQEQLLGLIPMSQCMHA